MSSVPTAQLRKPASAEFGPSACLGKHGGQVAESQAATEQPKRRLRVTCAFHSRGSLLGSSKRLTHEQKQTSPTTRAAIAEPEASGDGAPGIV